MNLPEPERTRFELRGLLCGVPLRIRPLFWSAAAVLGVRYYADPEAGGVGYFAFWMIAVTVCVLLSGLGQALVGRLFGLRGWIVLDGFGGRLTGLEALPTCRRRVTVLLAGPLVPFALVAGIWVLTDAIPFPETLIEWGWQTPVATGVAILVRINLGWGLLNVLPLWPLAGGRIASDVGETLWGQRGRTAAVGLSLGVTGALTVWVVLEMSWRLSFHYDPRYLLYLEESSILLLFCFVFWVRSFKLLWPPHVSTKS
jgi:Zn-dependent protease